MDTKFILPKPKVKEDDLFEEMVYDLFSREFKNPNLQRHGRHGQAQEGVDIVGLGVSNAVIGIQCKHHPIVGIRENEIDGELEKTLKFTPELDQYIVVTSAKNDAKIIKYVLGISKDRKKEGKCPVYVKFWDDIVKLFEKYPDLKYRYFKEFYLIGETSSISLAGLNNRNRCTINLDTKKIDSLKAEQIRKQILNQMPKTVKITDPYQLSIGLSNFNPSPNNQIVDLNLNLTNLFSDSKKSESSFKTARQVFNRLKSIIDVSDFSRELVIYENLRLTASYLLGYTFRKVSGFNLKIVSRNNVWGVSNLPHVSPDIIEEIPDVPNLKSKDAVIILNINRNIKSVVYKYLFSSKLEARIVYSFSKNGGVIKSAADALSVARYFANKIKNVSDSSVGIQRIHLFSVVPSALAILIGYHLNATCPIHLYFANESRQLCLGGVIK